MWQSHSKKFHVPFNQFPTMVMIPFIAVIQYQNQETDTGKLLSPTNFIQFSPIFKAEFI